MLNGERRNRREGTETRWLRAGFEGNRLIEVER